MSIDRNKICTFSIVTSEFPCLEWQMETMEIDYMWHQAFWGVFTCGQVQNAPLKGATEKYGESGWEEAEVAFLIIFMVG